LKRTIPSFIAQINKRQRQLEPHANVNDDSNDEFVSNLERLYTKIHQNAMEASREKPNTRIMLGFAAMIIESVKATQGNSDFIAEQHHYKKRYQDFYNYFVHDNFGKDNSSIW